MKKGIFITFEGPEGSGKTTHIKKLAEYLKKSGYSVVITREPGGGRISEKIREILLSLQSKKMNYITELFLYLASRAQHIENLIMPALKQGKIVLCDRFSDSTFAYQVYGRGIPFKIVKNLNDIATNKLSPDITILLDIEASKGIQRAVNAKGTKDRLESEKLKFHKRVRNGYLQIAKDNPSRVKIFKTTDNIDKIQQGIRNHILCMIKKL